MAVARCCRRCPACSKRTAAGGSCVLASGDPMFHGIGATLVRLLGAGRVRVLPHPSSVSLAAARLGWPLADVEVLSLVTAPVAELHPLVNPGRRILVLSPRRGHPGRGRRPARPPRGYGDSQLTVLEQLGGPGERRVTGTAGGLDDAGRRPAQRGRGRLRRPGAAPPVGARAARRRLRQRRPAHQARGPRRDPGRCSRPRPASCSGTSAPARAASASSGCAPTRPAARSPSSRDPSGSRRIAGQRRALWAYPACGSSTAARPAPWPACPRPTRSSSAAA